VLDATAIAAAARATARDEMHDERMVRGEDAGRLDATGEREYLRRAVRAMGSTRHTTREVRRPVARVRAEIRRFSGNTEGSP
jgi:hypothetical protein